MVERYIVACQDPHSCTTCSDTPVVRRGPSSCAYKGRLDFGRDGRSVNDLPGHSLPILVETLYITQHLYISYQILPVSYYRLLGFVSGFRSGTGVPVFPGEREPVDITVPGVRRGGHEPTGVP